jgi:competence protein ComEC
MPATKAKLWHYAPFLRLLVPLMAGIIIQWYLPFSFSFLVITGFLSFAFIGLYFFLPDKRKFQFNSLNGLLMNLILLIMGALLVWVKDIRHNKDWLGTKITGKEYLIVRLLEPLVEKQNSFKAIAGVQAISGKNGSKSATGKIIIYFKKDSSCQSLEYGSQIVFNKSLQEIKNSGNPGSFNYKQYCLFQGISHQVYLTQTDFEILPQKKKDVINTFLFEIREFVVSIIRKYIPAEKEQGLAEALLIGYKDDLDKNLVQSYSNTGVVHIIAISGLHLGLIYWLLLLLTKPFRNNKKLTWLRFLIIISCLWVFSLLAGGGPSVLRSAVMFTCIAAGEVLNRKGSIYNTLALSAFILLCINPFWLWDVGFQLSYLAVLSIIIFFRPIYNWFYIKNKLLDGLWKLNAVTLAAQILTLPISIFHFHQFPVLFLLANLIAVPLSSGIVIGEIVLVVTSLVPQIAQGVGWLLEKLIWFMNLYVERLGDMPFAVWNNLSVSIMQTILLLAVVASAGYWLMEKSTKAIWPVLVCLVSFFVLRSASFLQANNQKELIVYNVPKYQAIDVIDGRHYRFIGDEDMQQDNFIRNFHLQPSRVLHRIKPVDDSLHSIKSFSFFNKQIVVVDRPISFKTVPEKPVIDLVILSKNPKLYINNLNKAFVVKQVLIDGSVPIWKAKLWKRDCDSLHLPCYNVSENGAFVMKVQ